MKNGKFSTKQLVTMGLLIAIVLIMCSTPLGSIPVGPLVITLNMIPVAIAAVAIGPVGGLIVGGVFGMYSFLQALGIGVPSGMGIFTFGISPVLAFIQRFVSRAVAGYLIGLIYNGVKKLIKPTIAGYVAGCCASILNFIFFMGLLALLFGSNPTFNEYLTGTLGKASMLVYIAGTFVSNTIFEICFTTVVVGVVCQVLRKAHLIER